MWRSCWRWGLEDKILMTADCSSVLPEYEEAFAELDRVKNHQDVGYFVKEYALSLEPDMVIGWYSLFNIEDRMGDVGFWHERGIGTYTSINSVLKDDQSLQNEYADIRNIAAIYNKQEKAEEIIAEIEADVAKGKQAAAGSEPQRILIAEKYEGEYDIYHAKKLMRATLPRSWGQSPWAKKAGQMNRSLKPTRRRSSPCM